MSTRIAAVAQFVKRSIAIVSILLFFGAGSVTSWSTSPLVQSSAGHALSWSLRRLLPPLVSTTSWWMWGIILGIVTYLWWKHTLVMSLCLGTITGFWLAVSGGAS